MAEEGSAIGREVVKLLKEEGNLIESDYDGTPLEELHQKELILTVNQS